MRRRAVRRASRVRRRWCSRAGTGGRTQPACTNECKIAKRNAVLAEALGISKDGNGTSEKGGVVYNEELVAFGRANAKFVGVVERAFADFITSEKRTQVLPHMPPDRRKFVHDLAAVYRMDTQMVDQEPHRSVQLLRRVDTRIPTPVLSVYLSTVASQGQASLGRLADFRAVKAAAGAAGAAGVGGPSAGASASSSWRSGSAKLSVGAGMNVNAPQPTVAAHRGWTSVVATKPPAGAGAGAGAGALPASASWVPRPASSSSTAAGVPTTTTTTTPAIHSYHSSHIANSATTSALNSRTASPANVPGGVVAGAGAGAGEEVPDSWEDDV
ncbi:hypothetical protein D9613_008216 [Agrocybe pediades]|uniref:R3H domain-containing protein n=1 Tax=Agrocybe pediades TaxID=84607 RepID=A0A8H4QT42_9AGAR|nr:hypothetical protein D9613_008216 [Agrocybe pediades]